MTRTEWLLGGLLAILIVLVGAMGVFIWLQPDLEIDPVPAGDIPAPTPGDDARAPTPLFAGETALFAFGRAQGAATTWQADALLLSARATWPQGAQRQELLRGNTDWAFSFYSPGEQQVWTATVVGGNARAEGVRSVSTPLDPAPLSRWRLDSDEAVEIFLANGGDAFLQEAQIATLTMALEMDVDAQRAEWLISLFAPGNGMTLTMRLDAETGDVVFVSGVEAPES